MKKSEIREIFEKFIESFPDDETEVTEEKTEEVKEEVTEENTEEKTEEKTEENTEENTEEILTVEKTETVRKIDESGNMVTERKEIYVDETTGDYIYR